MDATTVPSLVTGLVSGVISSLLTYFSTRSKIRLDMRVEYDKNLHEKRLELYKVLWPKTAPLARYAPHVVLTLNIVRKVSEEAREWYFNEGGIYLSKRSRKPYFRWKEQMERVIEDEHLQARPDDPIDANRREAILSSVSLLRTSLADDIRTRRAPWL
ncbi:MAG: hypothetical protein WBW33_16695 [Bryobacteraceae bacterium]